MDLTQANSTSKLITVARHVVGMGLVALANPLIYYDSSPVEAWAMTLFGAILIALALFGLITLIQPKRAAMLFPMTPIKSAWLILALMLFSKWQDYRQFQAPRAPVVQSAPVPPKGSFTFEEAQQKTTESGPWLEYQK